ncbi:putative lipid II flippase FtsW [Paenibacillus sp. GP183]|uniref:putative lipid II flippase FtsW n=1 Tax=Paenibacillus sp. GP183 TaxID=1882751 RepID=UPI00089CFD7D|nr:putative lipid II flippase FtsW [Paenibacillus sp. GP183]SEB82375.1 cell division protein FtsW [Paenibacillus sp. GP183]
MTAVKRGKPDFLFLFLTFLLVSFGLVMVFSASAATSIMRYHSAWYFEKKQSVWAIIGVISMFIFMNIHYKKFEKWVKILFLGSLILLILVVIVGTNINGHKSWFGIGPFGVQPTELAKIALVLYIAALIHKKGEKFQQFKKGLLPVILLMGLVAGLIMLQPDIGSVIVILLGTSIVIIVGGANSKHLLAILLCVSPIALIIVLAKSYRIQRFTSFLHPWTDPQGTSYQLVQSLYAFGHGGITGTGFGLGIEKNFYLPEAHTDFIFSVIGEEFGFIGDAIFLLIYVLFLWRGLLIAVRCEDLFGCLAGIGIISLIGFQALVNLGGVTGSIPITGIPLPFISYGGSSLLISLTSIGILLSISREKESKPDLHNLIIEKQ